MVDIGTALLVFIALLGGFAWLGLTARTARPDSTALDDHVTARGSQGARALGLSFLATGMGAWILFVPPEIGAFVGLDGVVGYALAAAAPIAALAVFGPALRRRLPDGHSLSEFARVRFGRGFHLAVTGISMLYMLVFVAAELTALGAIAGMLTGIAPNAAVVVLTAVTLGYTTVGGLRASLRTDAWQAWLILALLAAGTVAALRALPDAAGSWGASGLLGVEASGLEVALTLLIAVTAANLFHQGYWQRAWAASNDAALRRGALLGAGLTIPVMLLLGGMGILAVGAGLDLGSPPAPFFALLGGTGTVVALVIFALGVALVASSVDSLQTGIAALTVSEWRGATLRGARVVTLAVMVPAVVVALMGLSVLRLFLVADLLAAAAVVPALLGLWRRATAAGALAGVAAGLAGAVAPGWVSSGSLLEGLRAATFPAGVPTLAPFLWSIVASSLVAVSVSLLTHRAAAVDDAEHPVRTRP